MEVGFDGISRLLCGVTEVLRWLCTCRHEHGHKSAYSGLAPGPKTQGIIILKVKRLVVSKVSKKGLGYVEPAQKLMQIANLTAWPNGFNDSTQQGHTMSSGMC